MKVVTFMKQVARGLQMEGNFGTAHVYRSSLNAIIAYCGKEDFTFYEVSPEWLKGFEVHLRSRGCSWNTVSTYLRTFRAVYNRAVDCLVQAADAISAARPGARRENLENYIKRLEMLEEITSSFPGVEKSFAIQAGREVRIMVKPDQVSEDQMVLLARDIAKKIEDELEYPGQIKVNLLRETKAIEYAK